MSEHLQTVPVKGPQGAAPGPSPLEDSGENVKLGSNPIFFEAKERFKTCATWESQSRNHFLDDMKFANADAYNGYQWPNDIRRNRDVDEKPSLTINKVRQHNLAIINDAKKNKPGIKFRPTGNGATAESATMLNAIAKHIEYKSNAQVAYDTATSFQVTSGIGYLRVATDYVSEDSFDQEPRILRVNDPLTVYMDPSAREADKSDMNFCFIFDEIPKDDFDQKYPEYKTIAAGQNGVSDDAGWMNKDFVRVCEYFRRVAENDTLYLYRDPQSGATINLRESVLKQAPELLKEIKAGVKTGQSRERATSTTTVEWYFIIGTEIVEDAVWPGKYIPIVPVIGEETVIDGIMDRKGHTRAMLDPQRMYNYWASTAVEYGALQTKTPWIAPAEAIEGYETYWNNANKQNASILPYNGLNDAGEQIPPPQRIEPPVPAPVALTGMQLSQNEMMMVSGQYADSMGDQSNERSAKAINERQRQGDKATYHYIDGLSIAVRHVGRIILDLIPHLYDTKRVMQILAEDGTDFQLEIDPRAQKVFEARLGHDNKVAQRILNPTVGQYEVEADIGPAWGTRREETFNALTLILTQAPQLTGLIGDLLLKSSDFDLANEAASRLRRMVPAQALGEGPTPAEQQLTAQVQMLQQLLQESMNELTNEKIKYKGKDEKRDIDVFNAFTQRIKVFLDAKSKATQTAVTAAKPTGSSESGQPTGGDPKLAAETADSITLQRGELDALIQQTFGEALGIHLDPIISTNAATIDQQRPPLPTKATAEQPPMPGARRGRDGHWYVRDFSRSNAYSLVQ